MGVVLSGLRVQFAVLVQLSSDTNASLERLFQILDCHRSGYITESAFISPFAKQAQLRTQLASTWEKFQALFDVDQDGRISREDFELGLKSHALHRPGTALNAAPLGEQLLQARQPRMNFRWSYIPCSISASYSDVFLFRSSCASPCPVDLTVVELSAHFLWSFHDIPFCASPRTSILL